MMNAECGMRNDAYKLFRETEFERVMSAARMKIPVVTMVVLLTAAACALCLIPESY
jgi:hypothetical protein